MTLISFSKFSPIFFLPIVVSLFFIANYEFFDKSGFRGYPIINSITTNIILCLFFIPFLFRKYICNKKSDSKNDYKINIKKKIKRPFLFTFFLGILYVIVQLIQNIITISYTSERHLFKNDYLFELCVVHFTYIIFSTKLKYKHHTISIIIILILALGFYALEIIFYEYYFSFIFIVIKQILFGGSLVFIDYLMKEKKYSIFQIIFIFGVVGIVLDLIVLIIVTNAKCADSLKNNICLAHNSTIIEHNYPNNGNYRFVNKYISNFEESSELYSSDYYLDNIKLFISSFKDDIDKEGYKYYIFLILHKIFSVSSICFYLFLIRKMNPCFSFFTNIIISLYLKIREFFNDSKGEIWVILIQIFILLIIIFWTSVYMEIVELNLCGLNDDTENSRIKRETLDERRTTDWANGTIISDADATLVDKSAI